jgi:hypothetical protein
VSILANHSSPKGTEEQKNIAFFPVKPHVAHFAPPPEPMGKTLPQWWRSQDVFDKNDRTVSGGIVKSTIKKCPSILDSLTTGYLLRVPVDIWVDATGDRPRWQLPKGQSSWGVVGLHGAQQASALPFDRARYCADIFRIHPLWAFRTPPGYSALVMHPALNYEVPWVVLPAVIETDQYAPDGAYSMLLERGFQGTIKQGTPLLQVMPFKRESWSMDVQQDFDPRVFEGQIHKTRSVFYDGYRKNYWVRKVYQ